MVKSYFPYGLSGFDKDGAPGKIFLILLKSRSLIFEYYTNPRIALNYIVIYQFTLLYCNSIIVDIYNIIITL